MEREQEVNKMLIKLFTRDSAEYGKECKWMINSRKGAGSSNKYCRREIIMAALKMKMKMMWCSEDAIVVFYLN